MKKLYFGFLFLLVTVMSFAQNAGDYQTAASGDWTNLNSWSEYDGSTWVTPAISYPGQINGSYEVSVSAAHTIDFRTTLTILHTGILNIAGTLNLDVAGNGNPDTINLNTTAINVNGGNLNFVGNKVRLNLPASAVITITSGGTITASSCNANNQIYIGANKYASCVGGGGGTYTFGEVVAAGGTVNAAILTPTSGLNSEACSAINIEGGYTGPDTNVTFNWILTDSNGNISNIGSGTLADNTQTDIDSFTPTTADEYLLSFEVTSGTFVNVETIVITVTADVTGPSLTIPTNTTPECSDDLTPTAQGTATATDLCDSNPVITFSDSTTSGNCSDAYTIIRTWTATDADNNTTSLSQTINVQDTTNPVLTVPADVTVECDSIPGVGTPTATDNCDAAVSINYDGEVRTNGACTDTYTLTRTWTATDNCNNTHTLSQTINVQDTTNPVLTVPADVTVECDSIPGVGTPTATDNCDAAVSINYDGEVRTNGACTDTYTLTRTWTATDNCNNTHTLSQTINVQDTTNPVLTVPADVTVECDSIPGVGTPTATDNCDAAVSINYDGEVRTNGACTDTYTLTRTWTATDNCNNTHTLSQTINVQDTTNPVLTVPADVTVECDSIPGVGTPTATDNCDAAVSINYDGEVRTNGACTDTYTLTRTWTATDNCNNTHTLSQTINVQDTTNPVLTVPADVTVECDSIPGVGTPTATDNCDAAVSINYDGEVRTNGACTDTYTLTRTWTATDNCNNTHTLSQTINVQDTTNPVLTVPADVTVECDSIPGVGTPTATDNCDAAVSINYDGEVRTNGACTDTYTLTRTWTATDNCNNTHTLSQTINVQDTTNPVLTVPADVTVECDSIPGVGTPTATDNCDAAVSINYDGEVRTNGACTDTYTLTRTWTATDNCNNTHTLSQTINVQDTTNPVLTVPADVTVECDSIPGVGTPTATDNCDAAVSINYDGEVRTNGACTDTYTLTRTWTATDNCNNTHTLSQTINVQDTTNPVLTVPADVTVECDSIPGVGTPTATDNCDAAVSINYDGEVRTNGACTDTYTLTRTWTATDNCNNTHTLSQTINVQDTTNPVLTVPADVTVECDSIPGVGTPTATDNCDAAVSINYDGEVRTNGACTDTYTLTRTWTATDNCNNTHTLSQTINVQDTTNPVLTVPADVTVECDSIPGVGTPTATDNCDAAVSINYDGEVRTNGACTDTYTLTRTWTATDNCNNTHTLSQTINVQDTTNPVLTVPADVTVECDSIPGVGTPTATDNCDAAVSINYDGEVRTNGACTDTYTLTRTWTATDNCNNTHTLSQTINVQDTTNPVLTVPADVTVECDSIPGVGTPTATDNCDAAVSINYDGEVRTNGACTDTYTLTRTWTATDNCNNTHTLSQTINVQDTTNPVLTVPADVTVECDSIPGVGTPTATDNCDAAVSINYDGEVRTNGACTDTYTLTRTWTATDNCNNTHTLSQTINVQDTTNPVLTVPADVTVECDSIPGVGTPTATDNCDAAVSINYDGEVRTNGACTDTYTLTRTWTATDNCNNTHTLSQTINVQDTTNPVLTVPADVTVECDSIPGVGTPTATDNCDANVAITFTETTTAGACPDAYTITRTWTATDNCGNTDIESQVITVVDTTDPVITTCLGDQNVSFDNNCEYTLLDYTSSIVATDNCGSVTITQSPTAGTTITATTQITITATDDCGNTSTCTFDVIPADNEAPEALCQNITVQLSPTGSYTISASDINNGSNDNCAIQSISVSPNTFDCNDIGDNTVTLTVTDTSGNTSNCTATVTVEDNTAPTNDPTECGTIGPLVIDDVTGDVTVTQAMINAAYSGTDACGIDALVLAQTVFGCNDIGTNYNVQLTITDVNGNSSTCSLTVIIEAPVISSGSLEGIVLNTGNIETPSDFIAISSCTDLGTSPVEVADDVELTLTIDPSLIPNIDHWEYSIDDGVTWIPIANTDDTTVYTFNNVTLNTFVRVVILSGNCQQLSPDALIRIVPPDLPPTIVSNTALDVCFPDPVTVNAESSIDEYGALNEGGLFNSANLNNLGWIVDGAAEMSAGGNNTNNTYWKETNGPKKFNGRCYDTTDNTKFAIVSGNSIYDAPDHTIAPLSTLETPIFSTVGLSEAILHFDQAYYLEAGAWNTVELSYDGGATYTETLNPGTATNTVPPNTGPLTFNYTGPSNSGFMDQGFNGQCNNSDGTFVNHATEITLPLGEAGLRIKFTYSGTANSVWALDNIRIPYSPVEEVLEWEDDLGNITYGNTITKTPITPGAQQVGVTALVNDCRADNDDGTTFVTFNASLGYAGQSFTPASGECGQSTIDLKAYDNTKTALENYTYGAYQPGLYTYPGELIDHDNNAGTATIPAPNYPGTGVTGSWSLAIVSQECATFAPTFDSATDPWTKFTAPPGVYDLTWTLGIGCSDVIRVTINSCNNLNFDGTDDFVSFKNNYALNSPFSIETWVKPNSITGNNTILSKRLATSTDAGYDLSLESNGRVRFNWFTSGADGYIESNYSIFTNRWYHIAVTFDGSTYLLYIDGIEVGTVTGTINAPDSTGGNVECLLGALDPSVGTSALATRHFNGWIDELRIWNKAITENQIRYMMNQEIMNNGAVRGEVVPQDIPGLTWATDLDGYYRMDVGCGDLSAHGGKGPNGRLRNIYTNQQETAPLPYTSRVDGQNWATDNSWTNFSVWDAPNSIGIDGITPIDWNIVQLSHNMNSGNKDITVLGLISDVVGKEFTIADPVTAQDETNDGQGLWVTHYLKLDGRLDLVGESQLIQKRYNVNQIGASIFDNASAGYAERDQQGTVNPFNYNYFSSPFAPNNAIVNNENTSNAFSIGGVLRDGTTTVALPINRNIVWTANNTAGGGNPTQVSTRWLYAYNDNTGNTYSEWEYLNTAGTLNIGLGYTMKGSGNSTTEQNYVYVGKPNNGTISNTVSPAIGGLANDILVGNPYPSAIDAIEFIKDNIPLLNPNNTPSQANSDTSESINGTIYFWEHYAANNTHILRDYQGGYATYNLSGGLTATTPPITEDGVIIIGGNGTVIPKQYVPIAQGFFVTGSPTGGLIKFHNDQRVFERENASSSVFFEANDGMEAIGSNNTSRNSTNDNIIQRLRLNFKSPEGADRPLLLAFTPNNEADDGFNYGYDAPNYDTFPSDLSWSIENERYVIQGVGQFDITKKYPFILELGIAGKIEISLEELENFDAAIDVYIYDALLGTYAKFNDSTFEMTLDANDYMDRFYLAFENEESLNVADNTIDSIRLYYLNDTKEIYINWVNSYDIKEVQLINIIGQTIRTWDNINPINSHEIKIPVKHISEGNYIIKVINSHGLTTNKKVIIKQ